MNTQAPDYLNPQIERGLNQISMPGVVATDKSLEGYGNLVHESPESYPLEIVRWPAQGWRPVDPDSGDEGGSTEGIFVSEWKGDVLYGSNAAVGGHYVLGYAIEPEDADENHARKPESVMLWHCNYHPDGGQLFYPQQKKPFVVPLALPGDDVKPEDFVCFWFDGSAGLYIHPNTWHEGVFTVEGKQPFYDKQGAVHARVSVDFPREFKCMLRATLEKPS
jgi:hypothetical protein